MRSNKLRVGLKVQYGPCIVGQVLSERLRRGNDVFAVAWREHLSTKMEVSLMLNQNSNPMALTEHGLGNGPDENATAMSDVRQCNRKTSYKLIKEQYEDF